MRKNLEDIRVPFLQPRENVAIAFIIAEKVKESLWTILVNPED